MVITGLSREKHENGPAIGQQIRHMVGSPTHHVAIYYGDDQMVEAPQTNDFVKISPLRDVDAARSSADGPGRRMHG